MSFYIGWLGKATDKAIGEQIPEQSEEYSAEEHSRQMEHVKYSVNAILPPKFPLAIIPQ